MISKTKNKIKVLIVDDSPFMRNLLEQFLLSDPELVVVGKAANPFEARDLIKKVNPDVLTLDIMMPEMDGITFLKNIMRLRPLPVVMLSSLTEAGSAIALEALSLGAVDYLKKPAADELENAKNYTEKLVKMVKNAAKANVYQRNYSEMHTLKDEKSIYATQFLRQQLIAIGSSTGGVEAIEKILIQLPKTFPGIVITQHIRQDFVKPFAKRINALCRLSVLEAQDGDEILPGSVYIAPSDYHLAVKQHRNVFYCVLNKEPPVNGHRPSVDVLFYSVAEVAKDQGIGIILTGMGNDGAEGAKAIHDKGGIVIAQDKRSSVVWGMPGAAVDLGAADYVTPLLDIPKQLFQILDKRGQKSEVSHE